MVLEQIPAVTSHNSRALLIQGIIPTEKFDKYFSGFLDTFNPEQEVVVSGWIEAEETGDQASCQRIAQDYLVQNTVGLSKFLQCVTIYFLHKDEMMSKWAKRLNFSTRGIQKSAIEATLCFVFIYKPFKSPSDPARLKKVQPVPIPSYPQPVVHKSSSNRSRRSSHEFNLNDEISPTTQAKSNFAQKLISHNNPQGKISPITPANQQRHVSRTKPGVTSKPPVFNILPEFINMDSDGYASSHRQESNSNTFSSYHNSQRLGHQNERSRSGNYAQPTNEYNQPRAMRNVTEQPYDPEAIYDEETTYNDFNQGQTYNQPNQPRSHHQQNPSYNQRNQQRTNVAQNPHYVNKKQHIQQQSNSRQMNTQQSSRQSQPPKQQNFEEFNNNLSQGQGQRRAPSFINKYGKNSGSNSNDFEQVQQRPIQNYQRNPRSEAQQVHSQGSNKTLSPSYVEYLNNKQSQVQSQPLNQPRNQTARVPHSFGKPFNTNSQEIDLDLAYKLVEADRQQRALKEASYKVGGPVTTNSRRSQDLLNAPLNNFENTTDSNDLNVFGNRGANQKKNAFVYSNQMGNSQNAGGYQQRGSQNYQQNKNW